jgi:hypothetical protein
MSNTKAIKGTFEIMGHVYNAHTRSEARSMAKKEHGLRRLPPGTPVDRIIKPQPARRNEFQ